MQHLIHIIDKVASSLEDKGLIKLATELDIVSNTLEKKADLRDGHPSTILYLVTAALKTSNLLSVSQSTRSLSDWVFNNQANLITQKDLSTSPLWTAWTQMLNEKDIKFPTGIDPQYLYSGKTGVKFSTLGSILEILPVSAPAVTNKQSPYLKETKKMLGKRAYNKEAVNLSLFEGTLSGIPLKGVQAFKLVLDLKQGGVSPDQEALMRSKGQEWKTTTKGNY